MSPELFDLLAAGAGFLCAGFLLGCLMCGCLSRSPMKTEPERPRVLEMRVPGQRPNTRWFRVENLPKGTAAEEVAKQKGVPRLYHLHPGRSGVRCSRLEFTADGHGNWTVKAEYEAIPVPW